MESVPYSYAKGGNRLRCVSRVGRPPNLYIRDVESDMSIHFQCLQVASLTKKPTFKSATYRETLVRSIDTR